MKTSLRLRPAAWLSLFLLTACHHVYRVGSEGSAEDLAVTQSMPDSGCTDLRCRVATCTGGAHTTLTGKVYAPNGTLPLYNATVYVPDGPVDAFPAGVTCDRCDGKVSGDPIAVTQTGPDGSFTLIDVPVGASVPLVIQLGHWRRQVSIPLVATCEANPITDVSLTRLPRNQGEGDIPLMAIATGSSDPFECLLLKIGIDGSEFTAPDAAIPGRIHFFQATDSPGTNLSPPAPKANELYSSLANLLRYDVILLPCEGGPHDKSLVDGVPLSPDPRTIMQEYLNVGGRVFSTHYSYDWLTYAGSSLNELSDPVNGQGLWPTDQADDYNDTIHAPIDQSFPKGAAFASWLQYAGATSDPGTLDISQGRHDITAVDPAFAQPWVTYDFESVGSGPGVMHFTANAPLDAPLDDMGAPAYCGRMVFSDFHVTANAIQDANAPFPAACLIAPMTDQEKALAFMLFDLSSCVQSDSMVPIF